MDAELQRILEMLDKIGREAEGKPYFQPTELDPEFLRRIEWVESLPDNQNGANKDYLERIFEEDLAFFAKAKRIR